MLNENLKQLRKSKGLTQEELAVKLNVVRQTISKWETGLSVPDSEMLIEIANQFEVSVATLLDDTIPPNENEDTITMISEQLALINEKLAKSTERKRRLLRGISIGSIVAAIVYGIIQSIALLKLVYENESVSMVGGIDGPTSVYMTSKINVIGIVIFAIIFLISICGIWITRKN